MPSSLSSDHCLKLLNQCRLPPSDIVSLSRVYAQVVELRSALKALNDVLLSITKLQNLKAIHNIKLYETNKHYVVINHKTTKFESNLQPLPKCSIFCNVVINHKTTKIESNSQLFCIKEF